MSLFEGYMVVQEIQTFMKVYPTFCRLIKYTNPAYVNRFDWGSAKVIRETKRITQITSRTLMRQKKIVSVELKPILWISLSLIISTCSQLLHSLKIVTTSTS